MLVVINDSPNKSSSKLVRAIIGRYLWKVARDIWVWKDASMRFVLINELSEYQEKVRIVILWKSSGDLMGFKAKILGNQDSVRNKFGLFLHDKARMEVRSRSMPTPKKEAIEENNELLW